MSGIYPNSNARKQNPIASVEAIRDKPTTAAAPIRIFRAKPETRPLTDYAHKWLPSIDPQWHQPGHRHPMINSGLTPRDISFGQPPLSPLSYYKEEEFLDYQRWYLKALTSRDLFDLHVLDTSDDIPDGNLQNEIHPVFRPENWAISNVPLPEVAIPPGADRTRPQIADIDNALVWDAILPTLQLVTQFLTNIHLCDWFDALLGGEREEVTDVIVPEDSEYEGVPFYRFKRRTVQERYYRPVNFVEAFDGAQFQISDDLADVDARTVPHGDAFEMSRIELSFVQILPLLILHGPKKLSKSQRLTQQFHLAVVILHELAHAVNAHQGHCAEPMGTQVRDVPDKMRKEKDFPAPSAQMWYNEIKRRYPLENDKRVWTEKQVISGLRGELKHVYPGKPSRNTELTRAEKDQMAGKNFNTAIRRLRAQQYFLPPWRQEPFFEDEETSELGYSMEGHIFGGQVTSAFRNFERDRDYQVIPGDVPFPTFSTLITEFPVPDPSPSIQRMYDECKRRPHAPGATWRAVYWPVSLAYIAEIQTEEFWSIYVRKYGGDLAKVYPKIRGNYKTVGDSGEIILGIDKAPEVQTNFPGIQPHDPDRLTDEYQGSRFQHAQYVAYYVRQRLEEQSANFKVTQQWLQNPPDLRKVWAWKAQRRLDKEAYDRIHKRPRPPAPAYADIPQPEESPARRRRVAISRSVNQRSNDGVVDSNNDTDIIEDQALGSSNPAAGKRQSNRGRVPRIGNFIPRNTLDDYIPWLPGLNENSSQSSEVRNSFDKGTENANQDHDHDHNTNTTSPRKQAHQRDPPPSPFQLKPTDLEIDPTSFPEDESIHTTPSESSHGYSLEPFSLSLEDALSDRNDGRQMVIGRGGRRAVLPSNPYVSTLPFLSDLEGEEGQWRVG